MPTRERRKMGWFLTLTLALGGLLLLLGLGVNVLWFVLVRSNQSSSPAFLFYVVNLLPGLSLVVAGVISFYLLSRGQQLWALGAGWLLMLFSLVVALVNLGLFALP